MVDVRVVMGWLMLSLGKVRNREKERSDMMKVDNGTLTEFTTQTCGKGDAIVIFTLHMEK